MNSSGDSSDSNNNYNNDNDSTNQDSNEGPQPAKQHHLYQPCSKLNNNTSATSTALRSTELSEL